MDIDWLRHSWRGNMSELNKKVSDFGEIRLLDEVLLRDVVGLDNERSDDCARIDISGNRALWSIDPCPTPVASWFGLDSAKVWGTYTATINLSDIAASGGTPIGMMVSIEMPDDTDIQYIKDFQLGLVSTLEVAGAHLMGGNVKSARKFGATGTILGKEGVNNVTRYIDSSDCAIYLIGNSGHFWSSVIGNHYGWGDVSIETQSILHDALCSPKAQTAAGIILGQLPFQLACMDCSDGPANALFQLAQKNSLDMTVFSQVDWPLNDESIDLLVQNDISIENACFQFGDWQLLCIVPSKECTYFEKALEKFTLTKIGVANDGIGTVHHEDGRRLSESSLNQNFSGGYNSINSIDELLSRFMETPIFE